MLKTKLVLAALAAGFLAFGAQSANAQATRTWVSGVGDDANPCSRTAPCKTFAGAISKTAPGGEIDALDPGGFGALTITKAITLDGGGGQVASVLVAGTNGIVVAAGATDVVTIRNMRFDGLGPGSNAGLSGIRFISGAGLNIENCTIFGFNNNGIDIALSSTTNTPVTVVDTVVSHNVGGISAKTSGSGHVLLGVARTTLSQNSSFGMKADGTGGGSGIIHTSISDSFIVGNGNGLWAVSSSAAAAAIVMTRSSVVANTTNGLLSDQSNGGAASILASYSEITTNATGVASVSGGGLYSYKNNALEGNYVANGSLTSTLNLQ